MHGDSRDHAGIGKVASEARKGKIGICLNILGTRTKLQNEDSPPISTSLVCTVQLFAIAFNLTTNSKEMGVCFWARSKQNVQLHR